MQAEQRVGPAKMKVGFPGEAGGSSEGTVRGSLGRRPLTEEEVHRAGVVKGKREVGWGCSPRLSEQEGMCVGTLHAGTLRVQQVLFQQSG